MSDLERAWSWRERRGVLGESQALRVFHGTGEGKGELAHVSIDRFGDHFWVTSWKNVSGAALQGIAGFLQSKGAVSAVHLHRPEKGVPEDPLPILGEPPRGAFEVVELGRMRFWIRLQAVKHPGLFLDHSPLRAWLLRRSRELQVLNTFAYTGSLSVAAGLGGATHVTTLDLSKATVSWAEENWKLNGLDPERGRFIAGDVFEWLPRLKREGKKFDLILLDPPSFSRGKKGNFSTSKDLTRLHELALDVLGPRGFLITSINSANVTWAKYESDLQVAASSRRRSLEMLSRIDLPETFPTRLGSPAERYLKGFILQAE